MASPSIWTVQARESSSHRSSMSQESRSWSIARCAWRWVRRRMWPRRDLSVLWANKIYIMYLGFLICWLSHFIFLVFSFSHFMFSRFQFFEFSDFQFFEFSDFQVFAFSDFQVFAFSRFQFFEFSDFHFHFPPHGLFSSDSMRRRPSSDCIHHLLRSIPIAAPFENSVRPIFWILI